MAFNNYHRNFLLGLVASVVVASCSSGETETKDFPIDELAKSSEVILNMETLRGTVVARARSASMPNDSFINSSTGEIPLSGQDTFTVSVGDETSRLTPTDSRFSSRGSFAATRSEPIAVRFERNGRVGAEVSLDLSNLNDAQFSAVSKDITLDDSLIGEIVFANELVETPDSVPVGYFRTGPAECETESGEIVSVPGSDSGRRFNERFESGKLAVSIRAAAILGFAGVEQHSSYQSLSSCEVEVRFGASLSGLSDSSGDLGFGVVASRRLSDGIRTSLQVETNPELVRISIQ